jgi:hypothetical protein
MRSPAEVGLIHALRQTPTTPIATLSGFLLQDQFWCFWQEAWHLGCELSQKRKKITNKVFSRAGKFLLKENLFISFAAVAFYASGAKLLDLPIKLHMTSLVFWSSLLTYQISTRLGPATSFSPVFPGIKRLPAWRRYAYLIIVVIVAIHIPLLTTSTFLMLLHLGALSVLYNVPTKKPETPWIPLRGIPLLKLFLIAYVWAAMSTLLPVTSLHVPVEATTLLVFLAHFLFILAITLPFDIRDHHTDREKRLTTIPHLVGIRWTKIIALAAMAFSSIILWQFTNSFLIFFFAGIVGLLIVGAKAPRQEHYYTFFIDGTIILYLIFVQISVS